MFEFVKYALSVAVCVIIESMSRLIKWKKQVTKEHTKKESNGKKEHIKKD
jgi:hypothetical protein